MAMWLELVGQSSREEEAAQNKTCRTMHKHLLVFCRILRYAYVEPGIRRLAYNYYGEM